MYRARSPPASRAHLGRQMGGKQGFSLISHLGHQDGQRQDHQHEDDDHCPSQVPSSCQPTYGGRGSSAAASCRTVTRQQCQPIQRNVCRQVGLLRNLSWRDFDLVFTSRCRTNSVKRFQGRAVHQRLVRLKNWKPGWKISLNQVCEPVSRQQCQTVPRQQCSEEPRQQCQQVPRQQCEQVPRQQCQQVPRQQCQTVPRQQCRWLPE